MRELKPTEVVKTVRVKNPRKLEKKLHQKYSSVRIPQTEYFRLNRSQVESAKKQMEDTESISRPPRVPSKYIKSEPISPKSFSSGFKTAADSWNSKPSNTKSSSSTHGTGSDGWHFERTNTKKGEIPIHNLNNPPVIEKNQKSQKNLDLLRGVRSRVKISKLSPKNRGFWGIILLIAYISAVFQIWVFGIVLSLILIWQQMKLSSN